MDHPTVPRQKNPVRYPSWSRVAVYPGFVTPISKSTTPGCPHVQDGFGVKEPRILDILLAEKTATIQVSKTARTEKERRILRFMKNNYTRKYRKK